MDPEEEPSETMHEFETLEGEVRKKKKKRPSNRKKKSSRSITEGDAPPTPRKKKKKKKRSVVLNEEESEEISNRDSFAEKPIKEPTVFNGEESEEISDDALPQKSIKESFVKIGDGWAKDSGIYEFKMGGKFY